MPDRRSRSGGFASVLRFGSVRTPVRPADRRFRAAARGTRPLRLPSFTVAQTRIIDAALVLFAEHGIGGTSLQMVADATGVTKDAVYHQYNTNDEIVLAVARGVLARL